MSQNKIFTQATPLALAPAGWPILEPGLAMGFVDRVLFVHIDARVTPVSFTRYLTEWLRAVDLRAPDARVGAIYQVPTWAGINAAMRKDWAAMLKSREAILRKTTMAMALCTPSRMMRGTLSAIFWLAPPPYPYDVVDTTASGLAFLARKMPSLDAQLCMRQVNELMARYERTVGPEPGAPRG